MAGLPFLCLLGMKDFLPSSLSKSADMEEEETVVLAEKWEGMIPSRQVSHYKVLLQAQTSKQWLKSENVSLNQQRRFTA